MGEQLYINDILASAHGIRMGDGFLDKLFQPLEMKDYIKNESRLEDGTRYITVNAKKKSRSLSLCFNIHGNTSEDYEENKTWLSNILYSGNITLEVRSKSHEKFRLVYTGKSISYGTDVARCNCKLTAGFDEPDPTDRGEVSKH